MIRLATIALGLMSLTCLHVDAAPPGGAGSLASAAGGTFAPGFAAGGGYSAPGFASGATTSGATTGGRTTTGTYNGALYAGGAYSAYRYNPLYVDDFGLRFSTRSDPAAGIVPFNYHSAPGYPVFGIWGGFGGADLPPSAYGYNPQGYAAQQLMRTAEIRRQTTPPPAPFALANIQPATLSMKLPGPGEVWVNGVKSGNKPNEEWTLTSPDLGEGEKFTFDVKARWEADGKNYECTREITVEGGKRSQMQVLGGTLVK